ncbi:tRNA lysidine(34) synthetase TilS [uncultured Sphingomonas sp.]|uniref:tRNA lysidine(34) synthetase TilS n=1 Tax=uncultured Sphingomonas sp. TaxID=158754 RepID=UPI0035CB30AB
MGTLAARFLTDLARVLPEGLRPGESLALAVSGGPDSMAMLALTHAALPGRIVAATVDHGLRGESAAEAEQVATACATLAVPHVTLRPDTPITGGNMHAAARVVRYALLGRWAVSIGAPALATAHHADDQAETFLMRAVRGAGPAGLAGIRARRDTADGPIIVRPLLGWRRTELADVAAAAGLPVIADPSNDDQRFERARVRRLLSATPWLDVNGLADAARHAGEADAALEAVHAWLWRSRTVTPTEVSDPEQERWLDMADLPREVCRRLAREAIRSVRAASGGAALERATNIEPLLDALAQGRAATQADVLVTPCGAVWRFLPAPPRRYP